MNHVFYKYGDGHSCREFGCNYCNLAICKICNLSEGSLTTDCPGAPVFHETEESVYSGRLDYRRSDGGWVSKPNPTNQSAVQIHLFQLYSGNSDLSESEIQLKFGLPKEEFQRIKKVVVEYLFEESVIISGE